MLIKTILFKNNLIKKIKSKNILKTKKKFWELKKDYKEVQIVGHRDMADSLSPHFNVSELLR